MAIGDNSSVARTGLVRSRSLAAGTDQIAGSAFFARNPSLIDLLGNFRLVDTLPEDILVKQAGGSARNRNSALREVKLTDVLDQDRKLADVLNKDLTTGETPEDTPLVDVLREDVRLTDLVPYGSHYLGTLPGSARLVDLIPSGTRIVDVVPAYSAIAGLPTQRPKAFSQLGDSLEFKTFKYQR